MRGTAGKREKRRAYRINHPHPLFRWGVSADQALRSYKWSCIRLAARASKSINQRLEDYWLGLRLQNMDIPAIQVVRSNDNPQDNTIKLSQACELYLRLKGVGKDKVFIRTANRNTQYVTKLLGDRPYPHTHLIRRLSSVIGA